MQFLHDVWVNWFEGVKYGFEVCHYHEWRKTDYLMVYERIPVVRVSPEFFDYVENGLEELPFSLLKAYKNTAVVRYNNEKEFLDFCVIFSDKQRAIAVDTMGYNFPIRKSRLTPYQESRVLEKVEVEGEQLFSMPSKEANVGFELFPTKYEMMVGLTRKERQLKKVLFTALEKLKNTNNISELRYWFLEWFANDYLEVKKLSVKFIWDKLYESTSIGWSDKHFQFCEKIIKGNSELEQIWDHEVGQTNKVT